MKTKSIWSKRVEQWRASGLTSTQYCEGKPFTAGGLRHAAHELDKEQGFRRSPVRVRMARVVRVGPPKPALDAAGQDTSRTARCAAAALVLSVGDVRVAVPQDFDPATLAAVLDCLAARGARS